MADKSEELAQKMIKAMDDAGLDDSSYSKREYVDAIGIIIEDLELRRDTTQDELDRGDE